MLFEYKWVVELTIMMFDTCCLIRLLGYQYRPLVRLLIIHLAEIATL